MFLPFDFYILKEKNLIFFQVYLRVKAFLPPRVKLSHESTTIDGITHEVLFETETKFRNALTANISTEDTKQIQIIKIIPPNLERNCNVS